MQTEVCCNASDFNQSFHLSESLLVRKAGQILHCHVIEEECK